MNVMTDDKAPLSHQKQTAILVGALVLAGLLSIGFYRIWTYERIHPSTEDAYLHVHHVWISPQLNGQFSRLFVEPNQHVKAGEPLFEIDPRQYQQEVTKAENQLLLVRHDVDADKARVESANARLAEQKAEPSSESRQPATPGIGSVKTAYAAAG